MEASGTDGVEDDVKEDKIRGNDNRGRYLDEFMTRGPEWGGFPN